MNINTLQRPLISIIMGIYNCGETLDEAIESILKQTYENWELIMCDDGSTDQTYSVALRYAEKYPQKIILLKNDKNSGLNYTLNRCLKCANGDYIARMDGDDICLSERFDVQLQTFKQEPNLSIVSTNMFMFDEEGTWGKVQHDEYPKKKDFVKQSPFCHAPVMIKREAMVAVGGYSENDKLLRVEDYHLWMKLYQKGYEGKNLHLELYGMRDDRNAFSRRKMKYRCNEAYVKWLIMKNFNLSLVNVIYVVRPIIVGIIPSKVYEYLHKIKWSR